MSGFYLTADSGKLLGPVAKGLGWIMDKIYLFLELIHIPNIALCIILFTIFVYLCMMPLTYKQQKFSMLSQKMQPELKKVQDKYKGKKDQASMQAMNDETRAIYDKYGVSPSGSCVQLIIQMPIFFALYRVFANIPAYLTSIKGIFSDMVTRIMATDGYQTKMQEVFEAEELAKRLSKVDFNAADSTAVANNIIDTAYAMGESGWDVLISKFPDLSSVINSTHDALLGVNHFINLTISETPWNIIKGNFKTNFLMAFIALLIPVASYLSQMFNIKLMPTANTSADGTDSMSASMKTMNNIMPIFSLFLCFTVPVGLGIYWVAGSVVRIIQQYLLNRHFKKLDLEEIIEKNKEKAAKKAEKRGIRADQIAKYSTMNTKGYTAPRTMAEKAGNNNKYVAKNNDVIDTEMTETPTSTSKPKPGSMAAKAALVKEFNEKNNK